MRNIGSAAIFGRCAACVLLSSEEQAIGPKNNSREGMYHFKDATQNDGFRFNNGGD